MSALYNEIEPFAAKWIRNLVGAGHIADGRVDDRSITEIAPSDLAGVTQAHFFAGIGVWSYALRLAGWPDDAPVWTGSCPCQPFSVAGRRGGTDDERHLWPDFFRLISECRPPVVFGEQVASPDGRDWLAAVRADLESVGYAVGAADLCSAGVGATDIRQRLYWVAYADLPGPQRWAAVECADQRAPRARGVAGGLADDNGIPRGQGRENDGGRDSRGAAVEGARPLGGGESRGLADRAESRREPRWGTGGEGDGRDAARLESGRLRDAGMLAGFWADVEWIPCIDGKWRPVEPNTFPLAHGAPARVGRLRAYGNAINAEVAATFIRAAMESGVRP